MKKIAFFLLTIVNCVVSNSQTTTDVKKAALDIKLPLISEEVYQALAQFFEYDRNIPLETKIISKDKFEGYDKEKLIFTGINNSKVLAYLITPKNGEEKHPIVFLVDGIYGSKERWIQDDSWPKGGLVTKALLDNGFAVMTLDAVYHGERAYENDFNPPPWPRTFPYKARQMFMQTAVEYRRAIDYISNREDIDAFRIGFLGLSMGGLITFELTSTDSRIKTAVAGLTPIWKNLEYQPWAPYTYASRIKCSSFLMFMGNEDPVYTMEDAHQLFDLIPLTEKDFVEYSVKHEPPIEYVEMITEWFKEKL